MQRYEIVEFGNAQEFLEYLSPLNKDRWPMRRYIFRGQPDAQQALIPSAHRKTGPLSALGIAGNADGEHFMWKQALFENYVINNFVESSDVAGFSLQGDSVYLRSILPKISNLPLNSPKHWPPTELHQLLAVAQHHGLPTCLLDWTRRAHVAAYFSAVSALQENHYTEELKGQIAVWALNVSSHELWGKISLVNMPGGTSVNMAAQAGLFTVTKLWGDVFTPFRPCPLEAEDDVYAYPDHWNSIYYPGLIKITLPKSKAEDVVIACRDLGISGSTLFPGFDGIRREVMERAYSDAKDAYLRDRYKERLIEEYEAKQEKP